MGTIEEAALEPNMRASFDFAVSRAVARLNVLCELCLPFVKKGGAFPAMKSVETETEVKGCLDSLKNVRLAVSLSSTTMLRIRRTRKILEVLSDA